jgi:F-type H+-transporting ATPase subunit a
MGILEIISELSRVISLSFRLFGNVFAGEVLLAVIGFLIPFVAVLPFYGLELFVGAIQAFIFALLALVFLTLGTTEHGGESHAGH